MAIQDEIENINDIICNIRVLMEDYFYTQNYIDTHFATIDHTHPLDTELDITSTNPVTNKAITTGLSNKADNTLADGTHDGLMSSNGFTKLDGIATEATRNIVDTTLSTSSNNAVTNKAITTALNNKAPNTLATNTSNGLLSSTDFKKLAGISEGATKNIIDSSLSDSSTNAVQNKVITTELNKKANNNTIATINNNGLMSSDYVNILTNVQSDVAQMQSKVDKNDIRILFLRYRNGNFDGADGTQLVVNQNQDYVYCQIDCDDNSYEKSGRTIRMYINGTIYERKTDNNGRTTSGKLIELSPGDYFISAFLKGEDGKNMVVDHKLLTVN